MVLLAAVLVGMLVVHKQADQAAHDKLMLSQSKSLARPAEKPLHHALVLPAFNGAAVVKSFNDIATDLHIPLDEIVYTFDDGGRTPYLQYRITLTTKSGYADVRKFLAALSAEMPNAALDAIRCGRADAAAVSLGCELTFSAFFSKSGHG